MSQAATVSTRSIDEIRAIAGDEHVRAAQSSDKIVGLQPQWIVEPRSGAEVASTLAAASSAGLCVIPRGGGTKIDWGNPPRSADLIVSTNRLNQVLEHAASDMTATVQAGCTIANFQKTLTENGQRLAVDPLWPQHSTIGGILATNSCGPLRANFGSLRDHLIGITVALADGTVARSGGKVVKNVAGYDLPKLFIGSFGTLGTITEATFRLYPLPKASRTLQFILHDPATLSAALSALSECALITTAVQIESSNDPNVSIAVLIEGLPEAIETKVERVMQVMRMDGRIAAEPSTETWTAGQRLFPSDRTCIASFSLLPTHLAQFCERSRAISASIVAQAVGSGLIAFAGSELSKVVETINSLRAWLKPLGGHLTMLRCPAELKQQIDVWPEVGNALPIMRKIKQQFDPHGTLSPSRFVGGI